jgi:hypothetical protein
MNKKNITITYRCKPVVKKRKPRKPVDKVLAAVIKSIDILIEARAAGAAVEVAKWAEGKGYNLKGDCSCGRQRR